MRSQTLAAFRTLHGDDPQFVVRAPGRANLIGEHTDYNDGFVLPMAVEQAVWIAAAPLQASVLAVHSLALGDGTVDLTQQAGASQPPWLALVRGAWTMIADRARPPRGARLVIGSDVPVGAGLSSSAAVGVGLVEAMLALHGRSGITQLAKARLAQRLERACLGVPCGIMDPLTAACGRRGMALLVDCRTLAMTPVPLPPGLYVMVLDTGTPRLLATSAYASRREECETAARILGVPALRDATLEMAAAGRDLLGGVLLRRVRHVVSENMRVLAMQRALAADDPTDIGRLLDASHRSLRDDYEVSVRALDVICDIARSQPGCYGARLMGAGFGGSALAVVAGTEVERFGPQVVAAYREVAGLEARVFPCSAVDGASLEPVA